MSHANPAKKIINDPLKCADELFDGLVLAYDGKARRVGTRSIVMNDLRPDAPALLVGGGAGHEPIYHGLSGKGMADGKKSLAFNLAFRSADRTLTDDEVNAVFQKVQAELETSTPYQIRK
jgi:hypothetical protein